MEYCKPRRHGREWNRLRVRDGNGTTPGGLLRLTRRARSHLGDQETALWVGFLESPHGLRRSGLGTHPSSGCAALARRYGITGPDGRPIVIELRRLRKTYKAEFYRATGGHYADIPALRPVHEGAVADGLTEALNEALQLRLAQEWKPSMGEESFASLSAEVMIRHGSMGISTVSSPHCDGCLVVSGISSTPKGEFREKSWRLDGGVCSGQELRSGRLAPFRVFRVEYFLSAS